MNTRSQKLAQAAFKCVQAQLKTVDGKQILDGKYKSFARKFPALIHTCGLAQAVAFALAKKETDYIGDLAAVLNASGHPEIVDGPSLDKHARTQTLGSYIRLSRDAIHAAGWLKRYAEALALEDAEGE